MKNRQFTPISQLAIPIDIITKTAMNVSLNAGKEIQEMQIISAIPEGITTDEILKMAIKAQTFFGNFYLNKLKDLKITPKDNNFSYNDIINMALAADFVFPVSFSNNEMAIMLPDSYGKFNRPKSINSMTRDEVIDNILKRGIVEGVKDFFEIPVKLLHNANKQELIDLADRAGLFNQRVSVGTGKFTETTKNVELYDSRKRNLTNQVTFAVNSPNVTRLTEFDYAVLDVCINEKKHGNEFTTINRIFHILGGGDKLTPGMRNAIFNSLERLSGVRLSICINKDTMKKNVIPKDQQDRFRQDKYGDFVFNGYLLPTESATTIINGKTVDAIHLLNGGAILNNAAARNQFATADPTLLSPPVRCTEQTIAINHFLLRRSKEIIGSNDTTRNHVRKLQKIITFDDMYHRIGIADGSRKQKFDARNTAIKILDFFVQKGIIASYNVNNKDGLPYSIYIDF